MREIRALGEQYGFRIIEDASHAVGGSYLGEPVGNCRYSDITVFSFHPVKLITTAEGGMARSEEHTSELQSLMRISSAVFCLQKKTKKTQNKSITTNNTQK